MSESVTPWDPLTGEPRPPVEETPREEVGEAVSRARKAFAEWSRLEPSERKPYLNRLRRLVADNADLITTVIRDENGKNPSDAVLAELLGAAVHARYVARAAPRVLRRRRVSSYPIYTKSAWVEYHPRGVAGVIAPWNYPFLLPFQPTATALAAGCTVVLKPSELTPRSGALVADLVAKAGFPPGAVEVIHGGAESGQALIEAGIDVLSFTGSTATARQVTAQAAHHLLPVVLELGGSDPMVVLEDADVKRAARGAVWGACFNAGQTCIAVERAYVVDDVYEDFVAEAQAAMDDVDPSTDPRRGIGPIVDPRQMAVIEDHVASAVADGATLLRGGRRRGPFYEPTLLVDVDHTMAVMSDETFGPVLAVMRVPDEETALRTANDSAYGLHGSVWTGDAARGRRFASRMRMGTVAINDVLINYGIPALPFGGVGDSGYGSQTGEEGLRAYCYPKALTASRVSPGRELHWFPRRGGYRLRKGLLKLLSRL
jgi:acyl-CoA reductase-like NAD-dependent aldehyde dehydrogenase